MGVGLSGKVVGAGFEPTETRRSHRTYLVLKVEISKSRTPEKAEEKLNRLLERYINSEVEIFKL